MSDPGRLKPPLLANRSRKQRLHRLAATVLLAQTAVIETVYPDAFMEHGLWAIALLAIMRFGPGLISLDAFFGRRDAA